MFICNHVDPESGVSCGREVAVLARGVCLPCYNKWFRPKAVCQNCGRLDHNHSGGRCGTCYHRQTHIQRECVACHKMRRINHKEGYCNNCYQKYKQPRKLCAGCGEVRTLQRGEKCGRCSHQDDKCAVYAKLGGRCECCHEYDVNLLTIDHVHNDGAKHRRELKAAGLCAFRRIVKEILASEGPITRYRLLCWSCNSGRQIARGGVCHDHYRRDALRRLNDTTRPLNT
jgi:hypothetical protein